MLEGTLQVGETIWHAGGCDACHGEGYLGRIAIYEVVAVDRSLEALIHDGAAEAALTAAARQVSPSLLDDGVAKLRAGLTSVSEVARVVREDS